MLSTRDLPKSTPLANTDHPVAALHFRTSQSNMDVSVKEITTKVPKCTTWDDRVQLFLNLWFVSNIFPLYVLTRKKEVIK